MYTNYDGNKLNLKKLGIKCNDLLFIWTNYIILIGTDI